MSIKRKISIAFLALCCVFATIFGISINNKKANAETTNIFSGKQFIPTIEAQDSVLVASWWKGSGYEGLTDGITNADNAVGRFSTVMNTSGMMDATVDLGGVYRLDNIRFYLYDKGTADLSQVGANLHIQIYYNGTWKWLFYENNKMWRQCIKKL